MTYFPYLIIESDFDSNSDAAKRGYCTCSTTCMAIGANLIADLEGNGIGVTWATLFDPTGTDGAPDLGLILTGSHTLLLRFMPGHADPHARRVYALCLPPPLTHSCMLGTAQCFVNADWCLRIRCGVRNWGFMAHPGTTFSFGSVLAMLAADTGAMLALTWYLERVVPGRFGTPLPPYFLLLPSYWLPAWTRRRRDPAVGRADDADMHGGTLGGAKTQAAAAGGHACSPGFEPEPKELAVGVRLHTLRKVFGGGAMTSTSIGPSLLRSPPPTPSPQHRVACFKSRCSVR